MLKDKGGLIMTGSEILEERIDSYIKNHKGELYYDLVISNYEDNYGDNIDAFLEEYNYHDFKDFLKKNINIKSNIDLESITNFKELDGHDNGSDFYNDFEINAFDFGEEEEKELRGAIKDFFEN